MSLFSHPLPTPHKPMFTPITIAQPLVGTCTHLSVAKPGVSFLSLA